MGFLDKAKNKVQKITQGAGEEVLGESLSDRIKKTSRSTDEPHEESLFEKYNISEDVFDADNDDFLNSRIFKREETLEEKHQKAKDVLEQLGIQESFIIPNNVYISSDMNNISFSISAPTGYDRGEVDSFLRNVAESLESYVSMLDQRNKDITELALYVDRVQAENKNLLYQAEMTEGINVLPTQNILEEDLNAAQLEIISLKEENKKLKEMKTKYADDRDENSNFIIQQYADKVSLLEREKEELLRKIQHLEIEIESHITSSDDRYINHGLSLINNEETLPDLTVEAKEDNTIDNLPPLEEL